MASVPLIALNSGTKMPWLGFGTGTALYGQDAAKSVTNAIQNGIVHLDGAQAYRNEETLGAGISASGKSRSELFITTKLHPAFLANQTVKETLIDSLKKLGVDFVDLFLVHSPRPLDQTEGRLLDVWKQVEEVQQEGLARSIGVSNFRVQDLQVILEGGSVVPAVNQIELHPYVWKAAEPIVSLCKKHGILIASYGGLVPIVKAPGGPVDEVLVSIAKRLSTDALKASPGQVLTKWNVVKGGAVVTTTSKPARIKEFQDVINLPELTPDEIRAIDDAGSKLHRRIYMTHVFE